MFWLAIITAGIFYYQLWQMRIDTRPWIEFKPSSQIPIPQVSVQMVAPIQFINVGKTPAKDLRAYSFVEIVDIDKPPHLVKAEGEDNGPWTRTISGIVFPEVVVDGMAKSLDEKGADRPITDAEYQRLMKGEAYFAISGIAFYKDVCNTKHWTRFCGWHSFAAVKVAAIACVANNTVDDNLWW